MMQQFFEQPGLGDDAPSAPDAAAGPGGPLAAPAASGPGAGPPGAPPPQVAPTQGAARAEATPTPAAPKPSGPPGKCKGAAKRERILKAAMELFAERDFHRVLMDDVAERAEVGKGTLYRYFATKEDLFMAVISCALDLTAERIRAKLERLDDPVQQLRFACKQALMFFRENGHLFRVLHHHKALGSQGARAELGERQDGLRHFAEHIIAEGRESGAFEVDDPGFASTILWGMIRTALRNAPEDGPLDELAGRIVGLFTNGISKR